MDLTQRRGRGYKYLSAVQRDLNRKRSKVRARAEHVIGVIKRVFGFTKVRYRGLAKNGNRLFVAAALANLFTVRRQLLATCAA
jgi:IS5 family transposase